MKRHAARELAMKALYAYDIGKTEPLEQLEMLGAEEKPGKKAVDFACYLVKGVLQNLKHLDSIIKEHAIEWDLERMPAVDRNIMRIALFEIIFSPDIPMAVSANEAIELAKSYGTNDSARFINGILGKVIKERQQPRD